MEKTDIFERVECPTRIVVNRRAMTAHALSEALRRGTYTGDQDTCELTAGGQVIAAGKIVKKGGLYYFKTIETAQGGNV